MTDSEQTAVITLCLHAAFADGAKDDREREQVRRIAEGLSRDMQVDLMGLYQDVLLRRRTVEAAVADLTTPELRQLAYEMALCVCDADGAQTDGERAFLEGLARTLGLDGAGAQALAKEADAIASVPLAAVPAGPAPARPAASDPAPVTVAPAGGPDEAALDSTILNSAVLTGALELLPRSLASMAVIPLQMRLVYTVGKAYGYELDRGHVKDLLATLGLGLTSQYIEEIGRKLLGKFLKKAGGGLFGALGRQATGSAFAFGTTYALGHVAKRYYAGGRTVDPAQLRGTFESLVADARSLQARYAGEIEAKARTIDPKQLLAVVQRGF
jgi:uncharacterized protein (DUF697 family)/tellurite resistance protein